MEYEDLLEQQGIENLAAIEEVVEISEASPFFDKDALIETCNTRGKEDKRVYYVMLDESRCGEFIPACYDEISGTVYMCQHHYNYVAARRGELGPVPLKNAPIVKPESIE